MKKTLISFALTGIIILSGYSQGIKEKRIKTKVNSVTVYLTSAEIQRTQTVKLPSGKTRLIFTGLSPYLNPGSIRITTDNKIDLLGITSKVNYLTKEKNLPKTKRLQDSLKLLSDKIQNITDKNEALSIEKKMLLANINIGSKEKGVNVTELKSASDFYRNRMTEILFKISKNKKEKNKLLAEKNKIQKQLNELNAKTDYSATEISVLVSAQTDVSGKIDLKYLIEKAGWSPSYDIKAEDINKPVKLEYRAKVFNNTGIDWKNVKIKLSTADPNLGVSKPILQPWYLKYKTYSYNYGNQFRKGEGYMQNKIVQTNNMPVVAQEEQVFEDESIITNEITEAEIPELSTEFDIKKTYDIPSDDKPYIVDINEYELPASYKHFAVTKLDRDVFLLARITGWQDLNLIEGPANVYYGGTYLGQAFIDIRNVKDTLDLSLGRDGKVLVTRTKLKAYSSSKIIGTKRKETLTYELIARNNRKSEISLQILDQIPISQTDEIEVKVLDISGAEMNETTGKLKWEFKLKPGETKKMTLSFEIKYPKDKEIEIQQRKSRQIRYF